VKRFVILTFLVLSCSFVGGQNPPYVHFRGGEDIPSSETYHVIQDRQGFIWIASANGVSRFDGYEFKNFGMKDGLPDNVIHGLYEDYKGRIWFVSYSGLLSYYFEGKIYQYKYNYLMLRIFGGGRGAIKLSFRVSKNDDITISISLKGVFKISSKGELDTLYQKCMDKLTVDFADANTNAIISLRRLKIKPFINLTISDRAVKVPYYQVLNPSQLFAIRDNKDNFIISLSDKMINCYGKKFSCNMSTSPIIWMSVDKSNYVWISKYNGGLECYKNMDITQPPLLKLFDGLSITSVLEDREGGYWFTTYANGVFYISNIRNRVYFWQLDHLKNGQLQTFCIMNNCIWVGFDNKKLFVIDKGAVPVEINTSFLFKKDISINKLYCDKKNRQLWILSNMHLYSYLQNLYSDCFSTSNSIRLVTRCAANQGDTLWIGTRSGLVEYDGHKIIYDSNISGDFRGYVSSIAIAKDGTKWLACSNGLWKYEGGKYEWLGLTNPILRNRLSELMFNPVDSSLWIASHGSGVIVLNKGVISVINQSTGLISDVVTSLAMGRESVYVGTSAGVNSVSIVPDISGKYLVGSFDRSIGIVSNEIVELQVADTSLIIGTREGLMVYPLGDSQTNVCPKVYITKFLVNGKDTTLRSGASYSYLENHISISFAGLTFKTLRSTMFRYKLHNSDSVFVYTKVPQVTLPALSSGSYNFQVWAQNAYGYWSERPATISFTINPPFWNTPWFIFVVSTFLVVVVSAIFAIRYRTLRRQIDLSRRLDGWKQQALLQQMNPHFIFNTLNSIQLFILQNDTLSSQRYLTKFAKLMRLILDNSQNVTVRLADEIETISLYLELEALRADGKFIFEIQQPVDLLLEAQIPSLIIQPFIENAIWHGLLPKSSQGKVLIQFQQKEDCLICTIEDNGIGRKAAESYSANRIHKSLGSKITMQRLQLLKSMHHRQLGIVYKDLSDKDGNPSGTRVELTIPILNKKIELD